VQRLLEQMARSVRHVLMPCYHPSNVEVTRKSLGPNEFTKSNGRWKQSVVAGSSVRRDQITVPCGHCLGCRTDQARQWAVRLTHEQQTSKFAWFVTLTYAETPLNGSLDPKDTQLFIKRLRRKYKTRISYYLCGEYGETTQRPHYHLCVFGHAFKDRDPNYSEQGPRLQI